MMTVKQGALIAAGTMMGYGLLHMWKPITFDWKDISWLPFSDPASGGTRTNWPAFAAVAGVSTIIVLNNPKFSK